MGNALRIWVTEDFAADPRLIAGIMERQWATVNDSFPPLAVEVISWSRLWRALMAALPSGDGPDILQIGSTWLRPLIHLGALQPWPESAGPLWPLDPIADRPAKDGQLDAHTFGIPWLIDIRLLYRRALSDDREPPTGTLLTMESWASSLGPQSPWILPAAAAPSLVQTMAVWLWSFGAELLPEDGAFSRSWQAAVLALYQVGRNHGISPNTVGLGLTEASDGFFSQPGLAGSLIARQWARPMRGSMEIRPIPPAAGGHANIFVGGSYLAVPFRNPLHPRVFDAVRALCTPDAQARLCQMTGYWPATASTPVPHFGLEPSSGMLADVAERGRSVPSIPHWRYLERLFEQMFHQLVTLIVAGASLNDVFDTLNRLEDQVADVAAVTRL
jgi:multiple sugar transport system substrate-binding protein